MLRRLLSPRTLSKVAVAGGIALSAYVLNEPSLRAAEDNHVFVINGCASPRTPGASHLHSHQARARQLLHGDAREVHQAG